MESGYLVCPLCRCRRRQFFCAGCLRDGDFSVLRSERTERVRRGCSPLTPSSPYLALAPVLVRFADVQLKYLTAKAASEEVENLCQGLLDEKKREKDNTEAEIHLISRRTTVLEQCIKAKRAALEEKVPRKEELAREVNALKNRLAVSASDGKNWRQTLQRVIARKTSGERKLSEFRQKLNRLRNKRIGDLLRWVFPITEKEEEGNGENPSVVESQLFEALNLTYFQGSWIDLGAPPSTLEDKIVAPFLPRVVDSPAFLALLSGAGGDGGGLSEPGSVGEKRISSNCALFFTNQTVQVLAASVLGVRLPSPLSLSSFVSPNETHADKCLALARLKRNVVSLCLAVGIPASSVNSADEILPNLIAISDRRTLDADDEREEEGDHNDDDEDGEETEEEARERLATELAHAEAVASAADLEYPVSGLPVDWESMQHLCPENSDRWQC